MRRLDLDPKSLSVEFADLVHDLKSRLIATAAEIDNVEALYSRYLEVLGWEAEFNWDVSIAESNLKALVGEHEGLDGVCRWKRHEVVEINFDQRRAREVFPSEVERFLTQTDARPAKVLRKGRGPIAAQDWVMP